MKTPRSSVFLFALVLLSNLAFGQSQSAPTASLKVTLPTIYIAPANGFETDIVAGFQQKKVPITLVTDPSLADYVLTPNMVTIHQESTGGKIARCLFAYCAGISDSGNVSVQLVNNHTKAIVWGYNVTKQTGQRNRQSMAEAIAKHFNSDFLNKQAK